MFSGFNLILPIQEELEREKQNVNEEYLNDWWGKMSHTFTSQFQALANNIAHYAEKGYNAVSQGVGNWQFNRGLNPNRFLC